MDRFCVTEEMFQAATRGEISWNDLIAHWFNHHHSVCPGCAQGFRGWLSDPDGSKRRSPCAKAQRLQRLWIVAAQESSHSEESAAAIQRDLKDLLKTPSGNRLKRWQGAYKRFRNLELADLLIEQASQRVFADPRDAFDLAQVAEQIARFGRGTRTETPADPYPFELEVRALAHQANALRAFGELRQAQNCVSEAWHLIAAADLLNHAIAAELSAFESSIRRDQREFRLAEKCLYNAIMLFQTIDDTVEVARAQIALGVLYRNSQRPREALRITRLALQALKGQNERHLELCAVHNLVFQLSDLDRFADARHQLEANEWRYRQFDDPWHTLRRSWAEAKIAGGLGELAEAERLFLETRSGFLDRDSAYDAALVSLELALLYLDQGKTEQVKELATEMLPTFQEKGIHREALAALTLFAQAAEAEQADSDLLSHVLGYLSAAKNSPGLRFLQPR